MRHKAGKANAIAQGGGIILQLFQKRAGGLCGKKRAAHDQQLIARVLQQRKCLHQLVNALFLGNAPAEQHNKIGRRKAQLQAQRIGIGGQAGVKMIQINAVGQHPYLLGRDLAGLQKLPAGEFTQAQNTAI